MAIVTLSRSLGSLGTQMAEILQQRLDLPRLDKSSLESVFSDYGETLENLERYDEKRPSFWDNFSSQKDRYLHFLKTAMFEFAGTGNALILGRGGQVILAGIPGVLKVQVTAPIAVRRDRLMEQYDMDENQVLAMIRQSDRERSGFHRFFFNVDWDSTDLYDLVINTREMEAETAVSMIHSLVDSPPFREQVHRQQELISGLNLGHRVTTAILYHERIPIQFLEAEARDGHVILRGSTVIRADIDRATRAAAEVKGVRHVDNHIQFVPMTFSMG
ncbi:MAG: cytidylate kinase family protein [Candidatus Aminicenantes bacterium]|nr:cytidylate kinase family protein [Candidatus Aminicenantes bacterium]